MILLDLGTASPFKLLGSGSQRLCLFISRDSDHFLSVVGMGQGRHWDEGKWPNTHVSDRHVGLEQKETKQRGGYQDLGEEENGEEQRAETAAPNRVKTCFRNQTLCWSRCVPAALHFLALDAPGINDDSKSDPIYLCQLE